MVTSTSSNYNNTIQSEPPRPKKAPRNNTEYKPNSSIDEYPPTYDEITARDLATRENIGSADIMSVEPSVTMNPTVELESVDVRPRRQSRVPDNEDKPRRASRHADDRQKRRSKVPREDSVDEFD